MKSYIFESVKELNTFLEAQGKWAKPEIQWQFQVVETLKTKDDVSYTVVDRFLVIMK